MGNAEVKKTVEVLNESDILYMIMTDRYPDGDPSNNGTWGVEYRPGQLKYNQGGDFQGIIDKLGYIKALGVTAIWISPPQKNEHRNKLYEGSAYHGYNTKDFNSIDEHFGTAEKLEELIEKAHESGIKVILDAVPNHTANFLDPFAVAYNPVYPEDFRPAPPFDNPAWYHHNGDTMDWDNQWELENTDIGGLDDLAQEVPEVKEALFAAYTRLINMGFSGVRVDAATSIPKWFLKEFQENSGLPNFGETYNADVDYVSDYQNYMWGVLDFPLFFAMVDVFASDCSFKRIRNILQQDYKYQDPRKNVTFLDNHDRNRFLCVAQDDYRKLLLGLDFLFASRGLPDVYYGTEQAYYSGGIVITDSIIDWQNREVLEDFDETNSIFLRIKRLCEIRKAYPVLSYGNQEELVCEDYIYGFARTDEQDGQAVISVFNNSYDPVTAAVRVDINQYAVGTVLYNLLDTSLMTEVLEDSQGKQYIVVPMAEKSSWILTDCIDKEYVPEPLTTTKIRVLYSTAQDQNVVIRGDKYPLWETRDREMRRVDTGVWEYDVFRLKPGDTMRFTVSGKGSCISETGEISGGETVEITLQS